MTIGNLERWFLALQGGEEFHLWIISNTAAAKFVYDSGGFEEDTGNNLTVPSTQGAFALDEDDIYLIQTNIAVKYTIQDGALVKGTHTVDLKSSAADTDVRSDGVYLGDSVWILNSTAQKLERYSVIKSGTDLSLGVRDTTADITLPTSRTYSKIFAKDRLLWVLDGANRNFSVYVFQNGTLEADTTKDAALDEIRPYSDGFFIDDTLYLLGVQRRIYGFVEENGILTQDDTLTTDRRFFASNVTALLAPSDSEFILQSAQAPSVDFNFRTEIIEEQSVKLEPVITAGRYDTITYSWTSDVGTFDDVTSKTPTFTAQL